MGKKGGKKEVEEEVEPEEALPEEKKKKSTKPKKEEKASGSSHKAIHEVLARGKALNNLRKMQAEGKKNQGPALDELLLLDGTCDLTLGDLMENESLNYKQAVQAMYEFRMDAAKSKSPNPKAGPGWLPCSSSAATEREASSKPARSEKAGSGALKTAGGAVASVSGKRSKGLRRKKLPSPRKLMWSKDTHALSRRKMSALPPKLRQKKRNPRRMRWSPKTGMV